MAEKTNTFLVIDNPEQFSELYHFQLELDNTDKFNKEIYIDAADLISIIYGVNNLYNEDGEEFEFKSFQKKMIMVHALIYYNHLGTVHLLNPHLFEFLEKINPRSERLSKSLKFSSIGDIIYNLNLINPSKEEIESTRINELLPFSKVQEEAEIRFKLMYLIDNVHPKKRANLLKNKNIVSFDVADDFNIPAITETKLFKKLYSILNEIKPGTDHNNFQDALALCQLQNKLVKFYEEPDNITIPLFYGREVLYDAAKIASKDNDLLEKHGYPFIFYGESGEHLIVQRENFFLLDALYNFKTKKEAEGFTFSDFFGQILEFYRNTKGSIENIDAIQKVTPEGKEIKSSAERAVHLDFFKKWWDGDGEEDYKKSLEVLNDFKRSLFDTTSFKYIELEFQEIYKKVELNVQRQNLGLKYIKTVFHRNFAESLIKKYNDEKELEYDLEQEFFTRFSYPQESIESIKLFLDKLYRSSINMDSQENAELKIKMLVNLQHVLNYEVLRVDRIPSNREKLEQLCVTLSILWIENEYDLLDEFCEAIFNTFKQNIKSTDNLNSFYPNYNLALLHVMAILRKNNGRRIDYQRIEEILDCIGSKYNDKNYKAWLGESFVYSKLWESVSFKISIPEIIQVTDSLVKSNNDLRRKYYLKCRDLAIRTHKKIKEIQLSKNDDEMISVRERRIYYAINLFVYIETLNMPLKDFPGKLTKYIRDLSGVTGTILNHERYLDTLARYNQRMAAKIAIYEPANSEKYKEHIDIAINMVNDAIKDAKRKNNKMDLDLFEALLNESKQMKIEGREFFSDHTDFITSSNK